MPRTLTWLHLSDLHACPRDNWHSDQITHTLVQDLQAMEKKHGLAPDFICFTGDAAWGTDPTAKALLNEQFNAAHRFFESVRKAFKAEIPQRRLYIVPGNHDIDRKAVTTPVARYLPTAELKELTAAFNAPNADLASYMARLGEYGKFLSTHGYSHLAADPHRWIFHDMLTISFSQDDDRDSIRVGIAGYNSAWSCAKTKERGELRFCGEWQHGHLFRQIRDADLRVGLIHHPAAWFADHAEVTNKRAMMESLHFLLHGHEHEAWVDAQVFPHSPPHPHATISAGSCYDRDGFPNGYNFTRLDLDTGKGIVFLRKLTKNGQAWGTSTDHKSAPEGLWPIECPKLDRAAAAPVKRKRPATKPAASLVNADVQIHRYLEGLRDQFSTYENLGLPVPDRDAKEGEKDAPIPIRKLFVAPTCTEGRFSPEAFDAALRGGKNPAQPLLPRLAPTKSRTVLLADPGMGKSTLIQWLIATLADEAVPLEQAELRGAIPLPFILRDLVSHLPTQVKDWNWDTLVDAFRHWRHRGHGAPLAAPLVASEALFRATLGSADAFFLIDGLDEIGDPPRRVAIRNAIWEGIEKFSKARWLVTSRIIGYEQAEVHAKLVSADVKSVGNDLGIDLLTLNKGEKTVRMTRLLKATLLHLAPFDDTQQLTFAQNWYRPRLGEAAGVQRAEEFSDAIHRHPHTRVISRVPNLLYLLALLYRHRARLPDGRALVYAAISSAYLADIDLSKHLPDSLVAPWKTEEKEDLLALVGMRMQELRVADAKKAKDAVRSKGANDERGDILVTRAQLEAWLGPRFGGTGVPAACEQLTEFLDHIAKRSGLLLPRGEGVFGFAHLSFQEFYAACHLQKDFVRIGEAIISGETVPTRGIRLFEKLARKPVWHEPLLFLVERLRESPPFTKRILKWMFPQFDRDDPAKGEEWMPFPAAQLLATLSIDPEVALDHVQREGIWKALWTAHIAAWEDEWNVAPYMVAAGSVFQSAVLRSAASLKPERFHLSDCTGVSDLQPLAGLTGLIELSLEGCTGVSDLRPLTGLTNLNTLSLKGCTGVSDLQPLACLVDLNKLDISACFEVSDLRPLAGMVVLNALYLDGCTAVSDLQPLTALPALERLDLDHCTKVHDLRPLAALADLNTLFLNRCTGASDVAVAALQAKLPNLMIHR